MTNVDVMWLRLFTIYEFTNRVLHPLFIFVRFLEIILLHLAFRYCQLRCFLLSSLYIFPILMVSMASCVLLFFFIPKVLGFLFFEFLTFSFIFEWKPWTHAIHIATEILPHWRYLKYSRKSSIFFYSKKSLDVPSRPIQTWV